jgi:hypothetical protein
MNRIVSILAIIIAAPVMAQDLASLRDTDENASPAIQQLVDESSGLIELPAGTFRLEQTIEVNVAELGYRGLRGGEWRDAPRYERAWSRDPHHGRP